MRVTFGSIKSALAKVTNLASTDSRVKDYANRAIERLLYEGNWVDTTIRYAVCVNDQCLVWPRAIETILASWICDQPMQLRGPFYEALENGPGHISSDNCLPQLTLIDRGNTVTFDWITTTGYKFAIYADGTESAGTVLVKYYDSNGNKVYTSYGGTIIEGERLTIPAAGGYTTSTYEVLPYGIYEVQKPVTNRVIRLYSKNISDNSLIPLAYYEPDETVPVYRMSYVTELANSSGCDSSQIIIIGKLRFIPIVNDDSVLQISNSNAVVAAVQSQYKLEANEFDASTKYFALALQLLSSQLRHHRGAGQVDPIRFVGASSYGGAVTNIV